jgi:hypothetical protein
MSRNTPQELAQLWQSHGKPQTITKVVFTAYWSKQEEEFDVWPPARPSAGAKFDWKRETLPNTAAIVGVSITETPEPPANPNHLHVKVIRTGPLPHFHTGGKGDIQNPEKHTRLATAYAAWWAEPTARVVRLK